MTAKDLLSPRVVAGLAEERLRDVAGRMAAQSADHCVVLDNNRRTVLGLVRLREVALRANAGNRILADLVSTIMPLTVTATESAEAVLELVEGKGIAEVVVVDAERGYVGMITAESALSWLQEQHRLDRRDLQETLAERLRLNDLVERKVEERRNALREAVDDFQRACLNLSHDVRTPLRAIIEYSHIMQSSEAGSLTATGSESAQRIERSAQKLQNLVNDLLDRARETFIPRSAVSELVDLNRVVDDVVDLHHRHFTSRNAMIGKRAPLPTVAGRYVPLLQILSNLLTNAVRYVPEGRQPVVEIWSEPVGGQVVLYVKDNGRGIADASRARIFDPFVRLDARPDGSGLGLAIARQAAAEIGAVIAVESEPGAGTTFSVTLGVAGGGPSAPAPSGV